VSEEWIIERMGVDLRGNFGMSGFKGIKWRVELF
jgi:hypothetical protein